MTDDRDTPARIQLPRLGASMTLRGYVIRCGCWRCRVPFLRRRHWLRLAGQLDQLPGMSPGPGEATPGPGN